jgi:hypothetical protein
MAWDEFDRGADLLDRNTIEDETVDGFKCPTDPALRNLCEGCE